MRYTEASQLSIKSITPQSTWLKTSCCLEITGTHQTVPTQSLNILFFLLSSQHKREEMKCFLAVVKAREAISHLYIFKGHLHYGK